jgi:putative membrane protein
MNKGIFMAGVAVIALVLPVAAAENSPSQAFIKEAVEGNLWEVQAGQLARSKASNEEVRKFGATLNSDHGEATRKASEAAQKLGIMPPNKVSAKHKTLYQRLSAAGDRFDEQFIEAMIEDHRKDVTNYEKQAQRSDDAASMYAKETLPRLREHLRIAEELKAARKK